VPGRSDYSVTIASCRRPCCVSLSTWLVTIRVWSSAASSRARPSDSRPARPVPIVEQLLRHDEDVDDVQMPLLIWWAIEDKAISDTDRVLRMVQAGDLWHRPLMTRFIIERLARRFYRKEPTRRQPLVRFCLQHARQEKTVDLALSGMLQALSGQKLDHVPQPLEGAVWETVRHESANPRAIELALRLNLPGASRAAIQFAASRATPADDRLSLIKALGESKRPGRSTVCCRC